MKYDHGTGLLIIFAYVMIATLIIMISAALYNICHVEKETCSVCIERCLPFEVKECSLQEYSFGDITASCICDTRKVER